MVWFNNFVVWFSLGFNIFKRFNLDPQTEPNHCRLLVNSSWKHLCSHSISKCFVWKLEQKDTTLIPSLHISVQKPILQKTQTRAPTTRKFGLPFPNNQCPQTQFASHPNTSKKGSLSCLVWIAMFVVLWSLMTTGWDPAPLARMWIGCDCDAISNDSFYLSILSSS